MKKLTKLVVLTGLVASLLVGCGQNKKSEKPASESQSQQPASSLPGSDSSGGEASSSSSVQKELQSIRIASNPTKTTYEVGEELDLAGLQVKAVYNTGEEDVTVAANMVSGFSSDAAADAVTVTVTYEGKTATFTVKVVAKDGIEITALPKKVNYAVGDDLELDGLVVSQVYSDGSKKALAASEYEVTGFDSSAVGPVELTVTVGSETETFEINVYAADWSEEELYYMDGLILLYPFPYYLSFELDMTGFTLQNGAKVQWLYAKTAFEASDDDFDAYLDAVEAIERPEVDDNGDPVLDDEDNPVMVQAWVQYNHGSATDDVAYLGYAADSEIYQYARWVNDDSSYFYYQVLTVGLDEDGALLVTSTISMNVFAGYGIGSGGGYYGKYDEDDGSQYDMIQGDLSMLHSYGAMLTFSPNSLAVLPFEDIIYPNYSTTIMCFIESASYLMPYIYGSYYSDLYDATLISYAFQERDKAKDPFTQAAVDNIKAQYVAAGYDVEEPDPADGSFTVYLENDCYVWAIEYYFDADYNTVNMDFEVLSYEAPFRGDYTGASIYDELSLDYYAYTSQGLAPVASVDTADIFTYYDASNVGVGQFFAVGEDLDDIKEDIANAAEDSGWLEDAKDLEWQDTYNVDASFVNGDADPVAMSFTYAGVSGGNAAFTYNVSASDRYLLYYSISGNTVTLLHIVGSDIANYTLNPAEGAAELTGTYSNGTVSLTLGGMYVGSSYALFLASYGPEQGSVVTIKVDFVTAQLGGVYSVQLVTYDGVIAAVDTWAEAKALLDEEYAGENDSLPAALNAEADYFVVDFWNNLFKVVYEDQEAALANTLAADLVAAGYGAGYVINGVAYYASENGEIILGIHPAEEGVVVVEILDSMPLYIEVLKEAAVNVGLAEDGLDWISMSNGAYAIDVENDENNKVSVITLNYSSQANQSAAITALQAAAAANGFPQATDPDDPFRGYFVKEVEGGKIIVLFENGDYSQGDYSVILTVRFIPNEA